MNTPVKNSERKTINVVFPKDSEAIFNNSTRTFGGATVQLYNFAKELCKFHHVNALINEYDNIDNKEHQGLNILYTFHPGDNIIKKIIKFHLSIRLSHPDVIIQRGLSFFSSFLAVYCRFNNIKYIFMYAHDRESRGRFQRTNRRSFSYPFLIKFADFLIVQNEYQKKQLPDKVKYKVNKIRNGYIISKNASPKKEGVLWVGRLEPWKQPEKFLELAAQIPAVPFTIIAPVVKKYEKYAEEVYIKAGMLNNVNILKFVNHNEIDHYFKHAKVFINTSCEEGFPNTFIQSCKNHTPIVSLNVNPDNFINRFNVGFCCDGNSDDLFNKTYKIMYDEKLFESFSLSAYVYAKENHSIEQNVKMLQGLF